MMTYFGFIKRLNRKYLWTIRRYCNSILYPSLKKSDITILSQNCVGGVVSHSFNMPFNTPTINMYFEADDFLKLCENVDFYLKQKHIINPELTEERGYIVTKLGDITVYAVHYHDFENFCWIWDRRKLRINKKKMLIVMTDRDGFEESMLPRIEALPYKSILYSYRKFEGYDFVTVVPKDPDANTCCSVTDFFKISGKHICEKYTNFGKLFESLQNGKE